MILSNSDHKMVEDEQISKLFFSKTPHVSIIIPNYNHARFIGDAIQSVLDQTYEDYEIIVVDDGSTDNSREIVEKFGNKVHYIWQENQGLPGARNTGLKAAVGEVVALLDADDQYEPDYLEELVSFLETNPEVDVVYCRARFMDENGKLLPQLTGAPVPPNRFYDQLLKAVFMTPNCVVAYRYCYEQVGLFDTSIPIGEGDMWFHFAERYNVVGVDKVLARYRVVNDSMSSINPLPMLDSSLAVLQKRYGLESDITQRPSPQRQAYGRCHITAAVEFLQADRVEEAYLQLQRGINISPELLVEYDIFFELGCGNQTRGYRGYFPTLDVQHNATILFNLLERLFSDSETTKAIKAYESRAYANAYLAIGMLSYGTGALKDARNLLLQAIATHPPYGFNRSIVGTLLKSLLSPQLLSKLRKSRQKKA